MLHIAQKVKPEAVLFFNLNKYFVASESLVSINKNNSKHCCSELHNSPTSPGLFRFSLLRAGAVAMCVRPFY